MSDTLSPSRVPSVTDIGPQIWVMVRIGNGLKRMTPYLRTRIYNLMHTQYLFSVRNGDQMVEPNKMCTPDWPSRKKAMLVRIGIKNQWEVLDGDW